MAFPTHFCVCALFLLRSLEGTLVVAQWIWLITFSTLFVAFGEKEEGWAQGHGRGSGVSLSDNEDCGAQTRPWKSQGTTWPITIKGHCCYSALRKRIGWKIFKHQLIFELCTLFHPLPKICQFARNCLCIWMNQTWLIGMLCWLFGKCPKSYKSCFHEETRS